MKMGRGKYQKGFAMMEALVFMVAFVTLTAYAIDFFSVIHTGIVNSTAARTYLFETLQHRANITYLRQEDEGGGQPTLNYTSVHQRFHAVSDEGQGPDDDSGTHATARYLSQVKDRSRDMRDRTLDSQKNKASLIWVKTGYGICLDSGCPGDGT